MLVFLSRTSKQIPDFWYSHDIGLTMMNGRDRLSFLVITNMITKIFLLFSCIFFSLSLRMERELEISQAFMKKKFGYKSDHHLSFIIFRLIRIEPISLLIWRKLLLN